MHLSINGCYLQYDKKHYMVSGVKSNKTGSKNRQTHIMSYK